MSNAFESIVNDGTVKAVEVRVCEVLTSQEKAYSIAVIFSKKDGWRKLFRSCVTFPTRVAAQSEKLRMLQSKDVKEMFGDPTKWLVAWETVHKSGERS